MPIRAVVYVSNVVNELVPGHLEEVVADAARFNVIAGVTGMLVFDGLRFLQYLEGPEDGLHTSYERVLSATSHTDIIEMARGRVGSRLFPYWSMSLVHADHVTLGQIAKSDWNGFVRRGMSARPTAVDYLSALAEKHL